MSTRRARVVILQFAYPLFNNPSIINFAQVMGEAGYEVDIFTDSAQPEHYVHDGSLPIRVHVLGVPEWERTPGGAEPRESVAGTIKRWIRQALPAGLSLRLVEIRNELRWLRELTRYGGRSARDIPRAARVVLVGSEAYGLAVATALGLLRRSPVVFWSFELNLWRERTAFRLKAMKVLEWLGHRRAAFTIIQSEERADVLAADNGVDRSRFLIVPSTARGKAALVRDEGLRARLGIERDRRIALYAGTIADWALCEELALAAERWPDPWVLVLHGWGGGAYLRRLQATAERSRKLYMSLDFVPLADLPRLIAGADVGLALYRKRNVNSQLTASASNKLGYYLRCGLPTVTSDFPGFRRLAETYRCVIPVAGPDEVAAALPAIGADYDALCRNAVRCYDERYDFDRYIGAVVDRIAALGEGRRNSTVPPLATIDTRGVGVAR